MNAAQVALLAKAKSQLGATENPYGSNRGPYPYMPGYAWCGEFQKWVYRAAGVSDDGIANASTYWIVEDARRKGRLRSSPVPGCMVVWRPGQFGHVDMYVGRTAYGHLCIGGNVSNMVKESYRDLSGAYFVVPSALDAAPEPVYRTYYQWEDLDAEPVRHGLYARESYRENAIAICVAKHGNPGHVRRGKLSVLVNGRLVPRFTFWTGPRRFSPKYATKALRDSSMLRLLETYPNHRVRPFSERVRIS